MFSRRALAPLAVACFFALSCAAPAQQEGPGEPPEAGDPLAEGLDQLGRGMQDVLRGLIEQVEPQLETLDRELRRFAQDLGPVLQQLSEMIGDIDQYHPPEMLPNGDIILRRRTPDEMERAPVDPPEEGQIDI